MRILVKRTLDGINCPRALRLKARAYFGNRNIKTINNREVENFRSWLLLYNFTTLHTLLKWVAYVEKGYDLTEFDPIAFEMRMRNPQQDAFDEVNRITCHLNLKIYIACLWLSNYVTARPIELLNIVESDIDADAGVIRLRRNRSGAAPSIRAEKKRAFRPVG